MEKTKPIYKCHRNTNRRCHQQSIYNGFSCTISPILHQQLLISILNYQPIQKQEEVSFSMEDFVRNLHSEYYQYYQPEEGENLYQEGRRRKISLQQINLQYKIKMQQPQTGVGHSTPMVSFSQDLNVKYYKNDDPPSELSVCEEFIQNHIDQNDQLYKFNQ